jgi:hypothetical protein
MKVTRELADATPVCTCKYYIVEGEDLMWIDGTVDRKDMWWVMCPNCHSTLGGAHPYPKKAYMASLCKK